MRKWLVPLLVIAGLLIAAVPAAANGNGDPGATIEIAEDGLSFSFSIGEGALAYWAWGYTCSGEEFGGHLGEWVSEGNIVAPSQIAYAKVGYTFPGWEEGDPYWFVDASGECPAEPVFDFWGLNAGCDYPFVGAGAYLGYGYEEPAVGVEVTFTMEGEDPVVTATDEWGQAWAEFPFEPGSDPVMIWVDAGEWGEAEVEVSEPPLELCGGIAATIQVSWPCGQEAPSVTFAWTGEFDWMFAYILTEGDEQRDGGEVSSITFEGLIPGATYYYYTRWGTEEFWGFAEGEFTVPAECTAPAVPDPWADAYNLIKYRNTDPARPVELKALFWIHVPPGFTAAYVDSVLKNCNTGALVPTASEAVKNYECTKEMADAGLIKNLRVVHVQVNVLTGEARSNDPDWPTSAYNPHWFGK